MGIGDAGLRGKFYFDILVCTRVTREKTKMGDHFGRRSEDRGSVRRWTLKKLPPYRLYAALAANY
jgi:hypothetical protein